MTLLIIYILGVAINLGTVIAAFSDDEFIAIQENNNLLPIKDKIIILLGCFLSWIVPLLFYLTEYRKK